MAFENNLFIGIGGTGGSAIAAFKRTMVKRHHSAAELIENNVNFEYLYIDSNTDIINDSALWDFQNIDLSLSNTDIINIRGQKTTLETAEQTHNISHWLGDLAGKIARFQNVTRDKVNVGNLTGAGQLRRYGRVLYNLNSGPIENAINTKIAKLNIGGGRLDIHIFATLGGGTGSGGIIDLITQLNCLTHGLGIAESYIHLTVFVAGRAAAGSNTGYFYHNEYAALRDINALMAGAWQPHLVNANGPHIMDEKGEIRFNKNECATPISSVFICSEVSGIPSPTLSNQVEYMADAKFSLIHACCKGLNAHVWKSFSGEDLEQITPGEPLANFQRSYRFKTTGAMRWCVPTDRIKELLRYKIASIVYEKWNTGSEHRLQDTRSGETVIAFDSYFKKSELSTLIINDKTTLTSNLEKHFDEAIKTDKGGEDVLANLTKVLTDSLASIQASIFNCENESNVEKLTNAITIDSNSYYEQLIEQYENKRTWNTGNNIWGMNDILSNLTSLCTHFEVLLQKPIGDFDCNYTGNMCLREVEWRKMGFITASPFSPKKNKLLRRHKEEAIDLLNQAHSIFQNLVLNLLYKKIKSQLDNLRTKVKLAIKNISERANNAKAVANRIYGEITNLNNNNRIDIYDFDLDNLTKFLDAVDRPKPELAARLLDLARSSEASWQANIRNFSLYEPTGNGEALSRELATRHDNPRISDFWSMVPTLDDDVCQNYPQINSVLFDSIYDRLQTISGGDIRNLATKIQLFIGANQETGDLASSARISRTLGLTVPQEAGQCTVAIGMPINNGNPHFVNMLRQAIENAIPRNYILPNKINFYEHNEPGEIRLLSAVCWMPARFADVVGNFVSTEYANTVRELSSTNAATQANAMSTLYFANLEDDAIGAVSPSRPSINLPPAGSEDCLAKFMLCEHLTVPTRADSFLAYRGLNPNDNSPCLFLFESLIGTNVRSAYFATTELIAPSAAFIAKVDHTFNQRENPTPPAEKERIKVLLNKCIEEDVASGKLILNSIEYNKRLDILTFAEKNL